MKPLHQPWSTLAAELRQRASGPEVPGFDCDVLIVGSGYGGAVCADALAGLTESGSGDASRVWLLERGQVYAQGRFPSRLAEMPGHVRFTMAPKAQVRGQAEGLFDLRMSRTVSVVLANGLGGGSLINAGVMLAPDAATLNLEGWPQALDREALLARMAPLKVRLRARRRPKGLAPLDKQQALQHLSTAMPEAKGQPLQALPVTVNWSRCVNCGDCATGCNHDAKWSLDKTLLRSAATKGARLFTGAAVTTVRAGEQGGWRVSVEHTDPLRAAADETVLEIRARRVILAAGTFGSTEILMRSSRLPNGALPLSRRRLGRQFSTNGDLLLSVFGQSRMVRAVACETTEPSVRWVGPTITHMIDLRGQAKPGKGHVLQDMAVPGPMRELFAALFTTAHAVHALTAGDWTRHHPTDDDPLLSSDGVLSRSQVLASIGHDNARGRLWSSSLPLGKTCIEGGLVAHHPSLRRDNLWSTQLLQLERAVEQGALGGTVLPVPMWQPTPTALKGLVGQTSGMAVTVHPLGGCAMGDGAETGVVNHLGQVFKGTAGEAVYDDLVVLDGSVMPASLGVNPALTIAALAQLSMESLVRQWGLEAADAPHAPDLPVKTPEVYRDPASLYSPAQRHREGTRVEITESLHNRLYPQYWSLPPCPEGLHLAISLTLRFEPTRVADLLAPGPQARVLQVDPARSLLQIHGFRAPPGMQAPRGPQGPSHHFVAQHGQVLCAMPLTGTLAFMVREGSHPVERTLRGLAAYLRNRGLRDIVQAMRKRMSQPAPLGSLRDDGFDTVLGAFKMASRAGEIRRFDYALQTGAVQMVTTDPIWRALTDQLVARFERRPIKGFKALTYAARCNPWRQLSSLTLTEAPCMKGPLQRPPKLFVDLHYFADQGVPLLRLHSFDNMVDALADLGKLSTWMARCLLHLHLWSFREPDPSSTREACRLPSDAANHLHRMPAPQVVTLEVAPSVKVELTRYAPHAPRPGGRPVLLIHGYSASGTTFAHPVLSPSLTEALHHAGLDVWILDMRTSPGLCTSTMPWSFEEVGYNDIPLAVDEVVRRTGADKVDVVAHCMGSAMLWMALLGDEHAEGQREPHDQHPQLRAQLQGRLGKVVLSQIAPLMSFSPINRLRAYLSQYLIQFLPEGRFDFRPQGNRAADTLLDRLLSAQWYPESEFRLENPRWPFKTVPWARSRHRMDALYGRDFNARQVSEAFLAAIDDHFGPMNLTSVSQAIFFARYQRLTDRQGRHVFVTPERMRRAFRFDCLYVHGEENGLSDIEGSYAFERYVEDLGLADRLQMLRVPALGHQDCLVGKMAGTMVFPSIVRFLQAPLRAGLREADPASPAATEVALCPSIGPILSLSRSRGRNGRPRVQVSLGYDPMQGHPDMVRLTACQPRQPRHRSATRSMQRPWQSNADGMFHLCIPQAVVDAYDGLKVELVYRLAGPPQPPQPQGLDTLDLSKARRALAPGSARGQGVRLVVGSCRYPQGMIDGAPEGGDWADGPADRLYGAMGHHDPDLIWLLGDQIYADETAGVFDPELKAGHHRAAYRRWLSNGRVRKALCGPLVQSLPDDHEFRNNWTPLGPRHPDVQAAHQQAMTEGRAAMASYLVGPHWPPTASATVGFACGDVACLMLDTRTQRSPRGDGLVATAQIMSSKDRHLLQEFLQVHAAAPYPKVIGTPAMLLPRRRSTHAHPESALASDAWDGYPASLHEVLRWLWEHRARQVWFVSGDEHLASQCTITLTCQASGQQVQVRSVHAGGFYTPYPFANSLAEDFRAHETFTVEGTQEPLLCTVSTVFEPAGECLIRLDMHPDAQDPTGAWTVSPSWIK